MWSGVVNIRNGRLTAPLHATGWSAPWYPDAMFMRVNPGNDAEAYIDYPRMARAANAAMAEYHRLVQIYCDEKKIPVPKLGEYDEEIRRHCGTAPKPIQLIVAAMQENPYILGETDEVDERLARWIRPKDTVDQMLLDYDFRPNEAESFADRRNKADIFASRLKDAREREEKGEEGETTEQVMAEMLTALDEDAASSESVANDIEDRHDQAGRSGGTVKPDKTEQAARQATRRPASTPVRQKSGGGKPKAPTGNKAPARKPGAVGSTFEDRKAAQMAGRPTLASGAKAIVAGDTFEDVLEKDTSTAAAE
ncbi:MAG TPA: hypothetical protein VNN79_22945 [Actinomycetota bacterium]|nr:hypothetical protein [Actinomycetota bacterium]